VGLGQAPKVKGAYVWGFFKVQWFRTGSKRKRGQLMSGLVFFLKCKWASDGSRSKGAHVLVFLKNASDFGLGEKVEEPPSLLNIKSAILEAI
jgi:hypothetical protein